MSDTKWESPGQKQRREWAAQDTISDIHQLLERDKRERSEKEKVDRRRFWITTVISVGSLIAAVIAAVAAVLTLVG